MDGTKSEEKRERCWKKRTRMERYLLVLATLLMLLCIALFATTAVAMTRLRANLNRGKSRLLPSEYCDSAACRKRAKEIKDSLDLTVDPCDNFYAFVCNNWVRNHPVPDDRARVSSFEALRRQLHATLKDILESAPYDAERQNITDKVILAYKACIDESVEEEVKFQALRNLLNRTGLSGWPIRNGSDSAPDWEDTFVKIFSETGLSFIIAMNVVQDLRNATFYVISFDQPGFGIGRNQLLNQTSAHNSAIVDAYKAYISQSIRIVRPEVSSEEVQVITEDILDFETELAKRTRAPEERRVLEKMYNRQRVADLSDEFPELNWLKVLNQIFAKVNKTLTEDEDVVIREPNYYNTTLKYLKQAKESTIHNYLGWRVLQAFAPTATSQFRETEFVFLRAVQGVKKSPPLWQRCVKDINGILSQAVGRIYIDREFSPQAKEDMEWKVKDLKEAFSILLAQNSWMDKATKRRAAKKLDQMIANIAYANWLTNDTYLNGRYNLVADVKPGTPFLETFLNFRHNNIVKRLQKLHHIYNRSAEWNTGPAVVNAFYSPVANSISFPAAVLQSPYYMYGLPSSLNMGAIGMIIGHEITHGFDDTGSQFDDKGNLRNWWTLETRKKFYDRAKCFVEQYGDIYDDEAGMHLNGINTQGENIADNGAVRAAFRAHRIALAKQGKPAGVGLTGLEQFTTDQLFFISTATAWCSNTRKEEMKNTLQYDTHSPSKYRVNIPMGNFEEFSEAFGCPAGSRMNISSKCVLW
ncbi:neprilysin-1-like [Ornithodoros turicata]|uniref:neprilysin-1-like n=1 Tax=Ornithodoros turicata TaxID=34597 RepID=UPI003138D558